MGTNYYAIAEECEECGRYERLHVCKSLYLFQGHFTWDEEGEPEHWLVSWRDWKQYLRSRVSTIKDEYGKQHDIEDFIARVEEGHRKPPRRSIHPYTVAPDREWVDLEGFQFYGRDFS